MRLISNIVIALLITIQAGFVIAETIDDSPEVVSLYARGKRLMREGKFLEASRAFEEIAGRFPNSPNMDLVIFNRAKSDYYFGDHDRALAGFANFVRRYPNSPYYPYAHYFHGNVNYSRGSISRAVKSYLAAYQSSVEDRLDRMVADAIVGAVAGADRVSLGLSDFEQLTEEKRCSLIKRVAPLLAEKQEFEAARALGASCGQDVDISFSEMSRARQEIRVAVVLPLSGELQSFADEIYNGAIIAAEFYRQETGLPIVLEPFDTKGDPVNAARIIKELSHLDYDAALGPLTSEEAAVASAALSCGNLPLIAPAATQAGLTLMNESSFQLSPNIELQGVQMAEYAVNNLMADSAAVITSTVTDDVLMSEAFVRRFEQLGGTIIATEYFRARDRDFGEYIKDIKSILLGVHPDSVYFIDELGDTLDPVGIPAHVDCLFIPGRPRQLKQLLPQINFYNLQAELLGSDDWGDEEILKLGDNNTRRAVFPSPFLQQDDSDEYQRFATAYDLRYGQQPQRLSSLGYDAIRLVTRVAQRGRESHMRMVTELGRIANYEGAAGMISFGANRENTAMPIYRIEAGEAVFLGVGDITSEEPGDEPVDEGM